MLLIFYRDFRSRGQRAGLFRALLRESERHIAATVNEALTFSPARLPRTETGEKRVLKGCGFLLVSQRL